MELFPRGRRHDDQPRNWNEAQAFIERPRMSGESAADYSVRVAVATLSRQIRASLQKERDKQRWA